MRTIVDAAGRLVIPKNIRRQAGLGPGTAVEIRFQNGHVMIKPVPLAVKLVRRGRLLVAVPETDVPPLTSGIVQSTIDVLRQERCGTQPG